MFEWFYTQIVTVWRLPPQQSKASTVSTVVMQGTGLITTVNTRRLQSNPQENVRELENQSRVLLSEINQVRSNFFHFREH